MHFTYYILTALAVVVWWLANVIELAKGYGS